MENLSYIRDLHLVSSIGLPLPEHIKPFALVFAWYLAITHSGDPNFTFGQKINQAIIDEYLDLARIQDTYLDLNNDLYYLIKDRDKKFRRTVDVDFKDGSPINEFYLRVDTIIPALMSGDVMTLPDGNVVENYSEDNGFFTLRRPDDTTYQLQYEDFFDYLARMFNEEPYRYEVYSRDDIALIAGQVYYINRETGEKINLLPARRIFVRNIGNTIDLVYNAQSLLALGMALLYQESSR